MGERPILFSAPMVRAILDGRKTQTRRVVRFPSRGAFVLVEMSDGALWPYQSDDGESQVCDDGCEHPMSCPYGAPGDTLWVRETWARAWSGDRSVSDIERAARADIWFRADEKYTSPLIRWRSSIHMPRWASRQTLCVTDVRVQRVQEISEEDARAEGVYPTPAGTDDDGAHFDAGDCRTALARLWDSINGKCAPWASNPWVWVVSFERIEQEPRRGS